MSYSIPDPRFEMPELLIPGRKPTGAVEIDWSNSYSQNLVEAFVFNQGEIGANLVGQRFGVYGRPSTLPTFRVRSGRQVADFDGINNALVDYKSWPAYAAFTIFWFFRPDVLNEALCGTDNNEMRVDINGVSLRYQKVAGLGTLNVGTMQVDTWYMAAAGYDSDNWYLWLADEFGRTINSAQAALGGVFLSDNQLSIGARNTGGSWYFNGSMACCYLWDRALGLETLERFARNPYQFLIPK